MSLTPSLVSSPSSFPSSPYPSHSTSLIRSVDPSVSQPFPPPSLVKYEDPQPFDPASRNASSSSSSHLSAKKALSLSDVLRSILPPREYVDDESGQAFEQPVSAALSSRDEVLQLQQQLDDLLASRQARESGICPVREDLYSQCFDELIRQVTCESPERGLLLMRVRDEVKMTIAAYQTLYSASITFGMRKSLQAEQGIGDIQQKLAQLEEENKDLAAKVADHRALYDSIEKRIIESRSLEEKKMQEEKDFLKYQAQHLESFLKNANN